MSSIILYLALLIIGGFLSYRGWIHKGLSDRIDKLQLACLFLLLFIMGLRIGMDERVIKAFAQIGFHAVLFGFFTILGSVICVHLMIKLINRKGEAHHDS